MDKPVVLNDDANVIEGLTPSQTYGLGIEMGMILAKVMSDGWPHSEKVSDCHVARCLAVLKGLGLKPRLGERKDDWAMIHWGPESPSGEVE